MWPTIKKGSLISALQQDSIKTARRLVVPVSGRWRGYAGWCGAPDQGDPATLLPWYRTRCQGEISPPSTAPTHTLLQLHTSSFILSIIVFSTSWGLEQYQTALSFVINSNWRILKQEGVKRIQQSAWISVIVVRDDAESEMIYDQTVHKNNFIEILFFS